MTYSYKTIQGAAEGLYKEKGSKFLSFAFPVESETAIKATLDEYKKRFFDARHHCYAWMLGFEKKHFRSFDDGEPNHSAGDPILGQIKSKDLTNVLVIVVRYFGGVKLGVGGLITAYRTAAEDALANAQVITLQVEEIVMLHYSYLATPAVMRLVKQFNLTIIDQQFEEQCILKIKIALQVKQSFIEHVKLLQALGNDVVIFGYT